MFLNMPVVGVAPWFLIPAGFLSWLTGEVSRFRCLGERTEAGRNAGVLPTKCR